MKRIASILLAAVLLLALAACGNAPASTPSLQLDDNGDNTFTVTAENARTDEVCCSQIILGENEGIQLEADFENSGELIVRFVPGEFEAASFPDEASELTIVGQGTESVTELTPGVYTFAVSAGRDGLTGTAQIRTCPSGKTEESAADYSGVTAMDPAEVEALCLKAKQAYLDGDWAAMAEMIRYPITVAGTELSDAAAFTAFMADKTASAADREELEEDPCTDLFFNGQGICLGAGEIWLNDMSYMTDNAPDLRVIALNGIESAE